MKSLFSKKDDLRINRLLLHNRFTLKIPPEWKDQTVYRFEGPVEDGVLHNIIVTIENDLDMPDLETYAERCIKAEEKELQGYKELKRDSLNLQNGQPAVEVVYKWCPVEGREIYQRVIYLYINETGYILTASFSKKTWKTFGSEVNKILMSFQIPKFESGA